MESERSISKFQYLVGMSIDEAKASVGSDYSIRPTSIANRPLVLTCDFVMNRINVVCGNDGRISKVTRFG